MRVCNVKDSRGDMRVSYKKRVRVPKACFRESVEVLLQQSITSLEAAMSSENCFKLMGTSHTLSEGENPKAEDVVDEPATPIDSSRAQYVTQTEISEIRQMWMERDRKAALERR